MKRKELNKVVLMKEISFLLVTLNINYFQDLLINLRLMNLRLNFAKVSCW